MESVTCLANRRRRGQQRESQNVARGARLTRLGARTKTTRYSHEAGLTMLHKFTDKSCDRISGSLSGLSGGSV
eukprot:5597091-Pleurochrysis_carterae.AAC.3